MPSPQTTSVQPELEPDSAYYRVKTHPRNGSAKFEIVGTQRGLPAWTKLSKFRKMRKGFLCVRVNDQIVVYWMDDQNTAQEAKALVLEIRVLKAERIPAMEDTKNITLLLVAWFYDGAAAGSRSSRSPNLILSSHIDVISIDTVKKVMSREKKIAIRDVLIFHTMTNIPASEVKWLPRVGTVSPMKSPKKKTVLAVGIPPKSEESPPDDQIQEECAPSLLDAENARNRIVLSRPYERTPTPSPSPMPTPPPHVLGSGFISSGFISSGFISFGFISFGFISFGFNSSGFIR
ncbi:uncharacterized protein PV07_08880 [Cladophialophora immunda]|uniref:Uncharacterized protein n=1 Tax=Cladophialophora immunda TaxID=569365 RepID=A0A0D2C5G4_9EURO|nr:uncharacterized protein PV07_08880 [Cladophialophora immunda]KIW25725.1 hypothetical protein PV07_08880 [Cladophialophora immunda]